MTHFHSLDEVFSAKKTTTPRAEWELEDLLCDGSERFGYQRFRRPQWDYGLMEDQAEPPKFGRLDHEDDASWTARSEAEQKKFIEFLRKNHDRHDGESKKDTLERLDSGHETLKMVLAQISWSINSETQPLEWKSYKAFEQACYKQYLDLVKGIFESEAYQESPDKPYDPADHDAVFTLGGLKATGRHGEYYARNICERLAKAWANGEHRPTFRKLRADEDDYPLWEQRKNALAATGVTIQGGLDDFECCYRHYNRLPKELEVSLNEEEAKIFAENYKPASHEFRNFLGQVTGGLRKDNVLRYLGRPYSELMEGILEAVETLEQTLTDVVCPKVSSDLSARILKENAITIEVLKEGLGVAKGY